MKPCDRESVIGDVTSLKPGQILLPSFMIKVPGGVAVDLAALATRELLPRFVDQVFNSDACFLGINYENFLKLLFLYSADDLRKLAEGGGRAGTVVFAKDIIAFPPERQAYYRGLKVTGDYAEYFFEQISVDIDSSATEGASDASGTHAKRIFLDFDEFVAALWKKGIRFGIDEAKVRAAIAADKLERVIVASQKPPSPGRDASIEERSSTLHRSDAPAMRPDGKIDLCHFQNHFPQVTAGTELVRKLPRIVGVSGWDVEGRELAADPVKDFELETLAGTGTRYEKLADGTERIVAEMDGFLDIDTQSSMFTISEKIISRSGVSIRTTGDLNLAGDEFEEHGEVQEKRSVGGKHMTFFADVFGNIESAGGRVVLKKRISGGNITNPGGSVTIEGSASRATVLAKDGNIHVSHVESSTLVGKSITLGHAVSCDIVADEVVIEFSEGCSIAAKSIRIGRSSPRKSEETLVTVLLPDMDAYEREINKLTLSREEAEASIVERRQKMAELAEQPDMKAYLSLAPKIKSKALVMTGAQEANWQALLKRIATSLREYGSLHAQLQGVEASIAEYSARAEALRNERTNTLATARCEIAEVFGDTIVRRRSMPADAPPLAGLAPKDIHAKLREAGKPEERLFYYDSGNFSWKPS